MAAKSDSRRRPSGKRHFALNLQLNDASSASQAAVTYATQFFLVFWAIDLHCR